MVTLLAVALLTACQPGEPHAAALVTVPANPISPVAGAPDEPPVTPGQMAAPGPAAGPGPNLPTALEEYVGPLWGTFGETRFYSAALDRDMPYYVYLPPNHDAGEARFPVLYMLHGASGDNSEWATIRIVDWTDQLIASGEIPPLILVLPQGDFGYWVNHVDDGPRWGDYVVEDLVLHFDETYYTVPAPAARSVGGLSQGGHAALQLTFNYPGVFGVAGAHSPSLRPDDGFLPWLGTGAEYARRNPIALAETLPSEILRRAQVWLDVGSEDSWRPRVELLHEILLARGVPHEFHVWPGDHDGDYWQPHVPDYLRFYGRALREAEQAG